MDIGDDMFYPLGVKTDFSILKSLIKIEDYISYAKNNGLNVIGILDDNLNSSYIFYEMCKKNNIKLFNVVTLVFSIISFILSFSLFFYDISEVGMYTKAYERIIYGLGFVSTTMFFTIISLIFALVNKKSNIGKIGLGLTLISVFLILTEIFVIVIY